MRTKLLIAISLVGILSCKHKAFTNEQRAFDKKDWATKVDLDYPYRDKMLRDLVDHYTLKGMPKDSLLQLLGPPDRTDNGHLFYTVAAERWGLLTLHSKTLVIKLAGDSTVEWRKIHE